MDGGPDLVLSGALDPGGGLRLRRAPGLSASLLAVHEADRTTHFGTHFERGHTGCDLRFCRIFVGSEKLSARFPRACAQHTPGQARRLRTWWSLRSHPRRATVGPSGAGSSGHPEVREAEGASRTCAPPVQRLDRPLDPAPTDPLGSAMGMGPSERADRLTAGRAIPQPPLRSGWVLPPSEPTRAPRVDPARLRA